MTRLIISGHGGRMGRALRSVIAENEAFDEFEIVAGFDIREGIEDGAPIFAAPDTSPGGVPEADVLIDFSNYAFVPTALRFAIASGTPSVIATTALGDQELALLREAAKTIPVFHSANMSLGVNLVSKMSQLASPVVEDSFNIEIIEKHHSQKKDAPSGTALMIAEAINDSLKTRKDFIYGRHGKDNAPAFSELGIHAVRGGSIPGQHTVLFAGPDEVIEITHTVYSNRVFAVGALKAARFLLGKAPGLYDMNDLLEHSKGG